MAVKRGPRPGYKQTPEHIAKRMRYGAKHWNWAGDAVSKKTGRQRAERLYPVTPPCQKCGNTRGVDRHHVDRNPANNDPTNVEFLCRKCHAAEHTENGDSAARRMPLVIAAAAKARLARTECKRGHPFEGNTYLAPDGKRVCVICRRIHKQKYLARLWRG